MPSIGLFVKQYGDKRVIDDVLLHIAKGEKSVMMNKETKKYTPGDVLSPVFL